MMWVETPSNPLLKIADLSWLAKIAKKHKVISVADNTFATPYLQRPAESRNRYRRSQRDEIYQWA